MQNYHDLLKHVLENGTDKPNRTGTDSRSVFGYQMRFNLQEGFPLVTTKKVGIKSVLGELLWFLNDCKGGIKRLREKYNCTIWDEWEHLEKEGKIVPYGKMWRDWDRTDQIFILLAGLKYKPNSRRHVLSAWNVSQLQNFVLPPCHFFSVFNVTNSKLSCSLHLRSNDLFLGAPYNIASYAALTHILAKVCGYEVGELVYTIDDAHIYHNHFKQVQEQLNREIRQLPTFEVLKPFEDEFSVLTAIEYIESLEVSDFKLSGYNPHPAIAAPVAV